MCDDPRQHDILRTITALMRHCAEHDGQCDVKMVCELADRDDDRRFLPDLASQVGSFGMQFALTDGDQSKLVAALHMSKIADMRPPEGYWNRRKPRRKVAWLIGQWIEYMVAVNFLHFGVEHTIEHCRAAVTELAGR